MKGFGNPASLSTSTWKSSQRKLKFRPIAIFLTSSRCSPTPSFHFFSTSINRSPASQHQHHHDGKALFVSRAPLRVSFLRRTGFHTAAGFCWKVLLFSVGCGCSPTAASGCPDHLHPVMPRPYESSTTTRSITAAPTIRVVHGMGPGTDLVRCHRPIQ